jgi:membrane protease YdiL (CAAX protease family)
MGGESIFSALGVMFGAIFLIVSIYVYVALLRQIGSRPPDVVVATERKFALPEAAVALFLTTLFTLNSLAAGSVQMTNLRTHDLIINALVAVGLVLFLAVFLRLRRFNVAQLAGFERLTFRRAFITGLVLMIVAYPLIILADWLTARVLGSGSSRQGIIELFTSSQSMQQRIIIIVLAITIAPMAEEFVFRFFLYGVLRRYGGRTVALVISALLFAAVHAHLPAFPPLFVLACCFTLAYEWSGSLLVPMTMHALFNAQTLLDLAFQQISQP